MQLIGSFSEFSWNDILDLVAHKRLSGWLCVEAPAEGVTSSTQKYQVWFQKGSLVAAAQSSRRSNGLLLMMQRQDWLSYNVALKMAQQRPENLCIGRYFRQQKVLDERQLQQLFNLQISPIIKHISLLEEADFQLDSSLPLPLEQMTGLKLPAYNAQTLARQAVKARKASPQDVAMSEGLNLAVQPA